MLAWGEFGRTPKVNGNAGRDHYPNVFSAAVAQDNSVAESQREELMTRMNATQLFEGRYDPAFGLAPPE